MRRFGYVMLIVLTACSVGLISPRTGQPQTTTPLCGAVAWHPATYRHVIVLMLENRTYPQIIGNSNAPYLNSLSQRCGLATNYHAVTHHSLPNYIAATSGKPVSQLPHHCLPVDCPQAGPSIFSQVSWHSYQESMPKPCDLGYAWSFHYKPQHNPAAYYTWVRTACSLHDTSGVDLSKRYLFVTPHMCDDMHGDSTCTGTDALIRRGDAWTQDFVGRVAATADYQAGKTLILITYDEGEAVNEGENCLANLSDVSCHVPLWIVSAGITPGTHSSKLFSHYSLLRTSESGLGVPLLGQATTAPNLRPAFGI
jgi:phosphatidylinositol-3-phosphatase